MVWKKLGLVLLACLLQSMLTAEANEQQPIDRTAFYGAMASTRMDRIESQLKIMAASADPGREAFMGTLNMKKASLTRGAAKKLSLFKGGRHQLEATIKKDSGNAEYRFLRLMIQENAPDQLGYHSDLVRDYALIRRRFKTLQPDVQQAIKGYSEKSKIIKAADL
jgi:hypothetical protein